MKLCVVIMGDSKPMAAGPSTILQVLEVLSHLMHIYTCATASSGVIHTHKSLNKDKKEVVGKIRSTHASRYGAQWGEQNCVWLSPEETRLAQMIGFILSQHGTFLLPL